MTVNRRLAAILAADVVGFSRLMGADEAGTLAALKARRKDILEPSVAKHQGRIFKLTGDGVLIEFSSAVMAVECALDLQRGFADANSDVPEDRRIILRIGVNLGDVMVEGGDLYGDGVNVAARLEGIADPGGLLLSKSVVDLVQGKLPHGFVDLGEKELKNIAQPIRVYRFDYAAAVAPISARPIEGKKVAIAVLPFDHMGGDSEQLSIADGIGEDLITQLSKYRELLVIARNSSFQFRGKAVDIKEVARKLGADFVVEGSVRQSGKRIRVTAQLIETESLTHVWAERYDRDFADIFAMQDEIVQKVCASVSRQTRETILHVRRQRLLDKVA